ncbi:MAG: restriction endonuclease [Melioribacteraceae bacterium]|nr:restriction endonuclease [Melioribacteraceae bacterium]
MSKEIKPQFLKFFIPIIKSLKELGDSGTASEVIDLAIDELGISEEEQQETIKNGESRVRNQAQWARLYLAKSGYISSSQRGIWSLTEKGLKKPFTENQAMEIIREQRKIYRLEKNAKKGEIQSKEEVGDQTDLFSDEDLLSVLLNLPPEGFERICQRLLREAGFQEVKVTGKSGDGGIDGYGILEVNPFVSFNVLFQSKRYKGSVSASQVRDFRGAMQGRADKGIIITTGSFTSDAKREARRDGAPPIELVDGEKLVEMFEKLNLGVIPKTVYQVDDEFFKEFKLTS